VGGNASGKSFHDYEWREAFGEMIDMCRALTSEASCASNPITFQPTAISLLIGQARKLQKLEFKTYRVLWQRICTQEKKELKENDNSTMQPKEVIR